MSDVIDELTLMVALFPDDTGLPMVVWASPSYGVGHDIRIKVMQAHGDRMDPNNLAVVALPLTRACGTGICRRTISTP